jgi:DHA1 family bicyclomycin/chloramphenicol resistance-like MFS transporter
VGAVLTENVYDVSPQAFGSLFALAALSNTCGALSARHLLKTVPLIRITSMAVVLLGLAALVSVASALTTPTLPLFWGTVCLYVFCFGMVYPTSVALAMEPAGDMPGFATSLMGTIQTAMGAGGAALASFLFDGSHRAIPITMAIFGLLSVGTLLLKRRALQV